MNFYKNISDDGSFSSPFRGLGGHYFNGLRCLFVFLVFSISSFAQTPQTITFPDIPVKGYGDATFTLNATASSGLVVRYVSSDVTVATVSGSTVTIKKTGAFTVISAYQDGNGTFAAATPVPQLLVVTPKATLTVTATDKTIDSGTVTPAFTYNITGFKNNETVSVVSGTPAFQSLATYLPTGTYPIVINKGTLSATNYDFQMVDGKLTVNAGTAVPVVTENDSTVKVYPNPASNVLHIDSQDNFEFSVIDVHGKVISHQKSAKNTITFPVNQLNEGFYFLKIQNCSVSQIYKVLIKR